MTSLLITDARIATLDGVIERGWLISVDDRIVAFGPGRAEPDHLRLPSGQLLTEVHAPEIVDAAGAWLLPGFIDVHVHGAMGHETMDGEADGLRAMARFYASHGVTSYLATTWTASGPATLRALDAVVRAMEAPGDGARLLGAHLEGPYLAARRCGAQAVDLIRDGDLDELLGFLATGVVRLITLAPEVEGNQEIIVACREHGVTVSAGHTDATYAQMLGAVSLGLAHVTHTFNAMSPLHHREPGVVGAAMRLRELTVELIADNVHVHPAAMYALLAVCGPGRVVLITDAIRAAGLPPGDYPIGDRTVMVDHDSVRLPGGALAGSVLTLDAALRNLSRASERGLGELWPTASLNAARVAGVADRTGAIVVGHDADLVLVGDDVDVRLTIVAGRIVHRADSFPQAVPGLPVSPPGRVPAGGDPM
jgi:N-acetylglucosamine-6-phosphate deacetylase